MQVAYLLLLFKELNLILMGKKQNYILEYKINILNVIWKMWFTQPHTYMQPVLQKKKKKWMKLKIIENVVLVILDVKSLYLNH